MLVSLWGVLFALAAVALTSSWEPLMARLVSPPRPQPASHPNGALASPSAGESLLAEARRLAGEGDLAAAAERLDRIRPQDPAYPMARRVRQEWSAVLERQGVSR